MEVRESEKHIQHAEKRSPLPWVEKYRPQSIEDIIAHEDIMSALSKLISLQQVPHLLFYGPPGTGKTTTVLSCARLIYGPGSLKGNVLELNASDERGIDVVRHQIKDFASTSQVFSHVSFKLVVLDEADQMTSEAQAALRRVMERYTKNVRFCILCNHVNKLIPAIQSRCTRFRFGPLRKSQMMPRLVHILNEESISWEDRGVASAIRLSGGDMRRCINILQGTAMSFHEVTEDTVHRCTGAPSPKTISQAVEKMLGANFPEAHEEVMQLTSAHGLSTLDVVRESHHVVSRIEFSEPVKAFLLQRLATLEHQLAQGGSEKINLAALVGAFQIAKESAAQNMSIINVV